jgi:hypothetical protein
MNRVNWGAIFAGAVTGLGTSLVLSYFLRATGLISFAGASLPNATPAVLPISSGWDGLFAVIAAGLAFAVTGASTALLGRFAVASQAVIHALAALALTYVFIHLFLQDGPLFGRAGLSWNVALGRGRGGPIVPDFAVLRWTAFFSSLLGVLTCFLASLRAHRLLQRGSVDRLFGERDLERRAA